MLTAQVPRLDPTFVDHHRLRHNPLLKLCDSCSRRRWPRLGEGPPAQRRRCPSARAVLAPGTFLGRSPFWSLSHFSRLSRSVRLRRRPLADHVSRRWSFTRASACPRPVRASLRRSASGRGPGVHARESLLLRGRDNGVGQRRRPLRARGDRYSRRRPRRRSAWSWRCSDRRP